MRVYLWVGVVPDLSARSRLYLEPSSWSGWTPPTGGRLVCEPPLVPRVLRSKNSPKCRGLEGWLRIGH